MIGFISTLVTSPGNAIERQEQALQITPNITHE
jgi:hypothetical protein